MLKGLVGLVVVLAVGLLGLRMGQDAALNRVESPGQVQQPDSAIAAAIAGGTTLLCRHAITDDTRETEPVDYDDPSTQRLLSPEGERQSAELGRALTGLGVRVTELIASPMSRARRTAELMFADRSVVIDSIWHTNGGSYRGAPLRRRLQALAEPVDDGTRLIVSHIGTISSAVPSARRQMAEGDCAVIRGEAQRHRLIGFVKWQAWLEAAG